MKNILVTGGLGFIGSETVIALIKAGYTPIIADNLYNAKKSVLLAYQDDYRRGAQVL
jgi:UDP-glucose 4-epimerase